ncbi:MAG: hypothetical protein ACXWDQ_01235 [Solirubrobacterales bacterium]
MPPNDAPEPTELVSPPPSSWAPVLLAGGLALLIAGLFTWWPYAAIGAFVALLALRGWLRAAGRDIAALPRRQRISTAPIPLSAPPPREPVA